jgi:adenylosuccinate lyase
MKVWDENEDFLALLKEDADIGAHLSRAEIDHVFTLKTYLRNVSAIFDRVFGKIDESADHAQQTGR